MHFIFEQTKPKNRKDKKDFEEGKKKMIRRFETFYDYQAQRLLPLLQSEIDDVKELIDNNTVTDLLDNLEVYHGDGEIKRLVNGYLYIHGTMTMSLADILFEIRGNDEHLRRFYRFLKSQSCDDVLKMTEIPREGIDTLLEDEEARVEAEAESAGEQASVVQEQNTVFTDQRETVSDQGYITSQELPNLQKYSMPEEEWHVRNVMAKPIPFYAGAWSTSDTLGKKLAEWMVPGDTLFGPHYNLLSTFTYFRGHPVVRFQLNGTKFHAGRLIVAFIPFYQFGNYEDKLFTVSNLTSLPHVILDAGIANSGVLELPFVHINTYFNTVAGDRPWQSLGTLVCCVYNRLRAATSSTQTIGLTAWIHFENCELHQPCYAHDVSLPKRGKTSFAIAESLVEGLVKSAVPMVKDLITPELGMIGDVLGGAANLDKPTDPIEISRWVPNTVTGMTRGDGLDRCERLCLTTGGYTIPDADLISTTKDDMSLRELCKIPTRVDFFDWNVTDVSGKRLLHLPVCPNVVEKLEADSTITPPVTTFSPTLLGYISRYFKYWRGGLRYKIQMIASQMHTGRLLVSFGAGLELGANDFAKASYLNTYVIDLQEKHEVEFIVPFMSERPWLRCDRCRDKSSSGTGVDADSGFFEQTGYLDIFVLNQLARPEAVSSIISVNVLISAAEDFELAFPSDLAYFQGIGLPIVQKTKAEAESLMEQDTVTSREDEGVMTLGRGSGRLAIAGPTTMGEDAMDLKTLLRRYTKVYHNTAKVGDDFRFIAFDNTPVLSSVNKCFNSKNGRQYRTALAHFSELFTFWRGSLRYKLVYKVGAKSSDFTTPALTMRVYHMPGVFNYGTFTPETTSLERKPIFDAFEAYGVQVAVSELQGSLEFEIPFYTPYTQLKTMHSGIPNARNATGRVFVVMEAPISTSDMKISFDLYQAAGDDFTLNYLRAAPRMQFVADTDQNRLVYDNADWIYVQAKTICAAPLPLPVVERPLSLQDKASEAEHVIEKISTLAVAEGLTDYLPGVSHVKVSAERFNHSVSKLSDVCDTANHVLLKASKKLGISDLSEEEKEEGSTTLIDDASSLLKGMTSPLQPAIEVLLASLRSLPDTFAKYANINMTASEVMVELSHLVTGMTAFTKGTSFVQKACAIVTIVSVLIRDVSTQIKNKLFEFASTVLASLANRIDGCNEGNRQPVTEGFSLDLLAPIAASAVVGLGIVGFKRIPTDKETVDMCRGMSEKLRLFNFSSLAMTNIRKLWNEIKELMQWGVDYILEKFQPQLLAQLKLEREFEDIEEWTKFIDSLENIGYADKIHYDYEFKNKVYAAIDQGNKYNALLLAGKCGRAASVIREYCRKAIEIGHHCENSKNELPYRMDPYCVCLFGESNIGKSGCITTLGYDMMDALGYPLYNRWCAVNCSEAFFTENYRQQSAVYFDDFSTFTSEEQYNKFMNLKANTALPLNMAFRKGEYFNSHFVFMTTNTPYPSPNFVTNHTALLRRRDKLVEAAWADDEDIQEALNRGENMMNYRRLDNGHLKFRIVDSVDEMAQPGAWMTYDQLREVLIREAHAHLQNQKRKVTADLTRAGYIQPEAESGVVRKISLEACLNSPTLRLLDPQLWSHLVWDATAQEFDLFVAEDDEDREYLVDQWNDAIEFLETMGTPMQQTLLMHSYIVKEKQTLVSRITGKISEFKTWISEKVKGILEDHPWIGLIARWGIIFTGALAAGSILFKVGGSVLHKCACALVRYYGYRCGICGQWPAFKNVAPENQQWMLKEWSGLYGNEDYIDGHITTIEEENAILFIEGRTRKIEKPEFGTKVKAEGIYSDDTRGMAAMKVTAQGGPYSQDVKGLPAVKCVAQGRHESKPVRVKKAKAESRTDDVIVNRMFPYLYRMKSRGAKGVPSQSLNGFAIGDRKMMINSHFFTGMQEGDLFDCYHNGAWIEVEYRKELAYSFPNKDIVIYEMPKSFHQHRSNVKHFVSERELGYLQACTGSLVKTSATLQHMIVAGLKVKAVRQIAFKQTNPGSTEHYLVQNGWRYTKCSAAGDCGSPLVCSEGGAQGKILGIHTASDPMYSYAQLVTCEMLEEHVRRMLGTPLPETEAKFGNLIPPGHLGRVGKALPGKAVFPKGDTEIIKTEIHGMIAEPETFPAVQRVNDPRLEHRVNPFRLAIEKYSFTSKPFPHRHREIVNEMMKDDVKYMELSREPRVLEWSEAVGGIELLDGYDRLPLSTSPGYPWILSRPAGETGKAYLFDVDISLPKPLLMKRVLEREELARKGERIQSVWMDCLKDERRAEEKIKKGSTRMFTIPPVDFSLLMRKYTLDFSCAVKNSRHFQEC